jgi:hypothetical protein
MSQRQGSWPFNKEKKGARLENTTLWTFTYIVTSVNVLLERRHHSKLVALICLRRHILQYVPL